MNVSKNLTKILLVTLLVTLVGAAAARPSSGAGPVDVSMAGLAMLSALPEPVLDPLTDPPGTFHTIDGIPHFLSADAGQHLLALMASFDVARTTIRDAFRVLETEGLLEVRRGGGGGGRVQAPGVGMVASYAALLLQYRADAG